MKKIKEPTRIEGSIVYDPKLMKTVIVWNSYRRVADFIGEYDPTPIDKLIEDLNAIKTNY
jgi:hypothetical protein